ncbi:MAG TPA: TIGR02530 family flagellar biosynthesis protein [Anaerolineales bacterium]|nr:TIGR02530 family flagellar biosynthesis protein [Anaerolineales bacterium]
MTQDLRITNAYAAAAQRPAAATKTAAPGAFAAELQQAELRFSNHAQKRLEKRDIALSTDDLARLSLAVDNAAKRGGKDSLVLMDDMAFVVNVRDRLVVTAVDAKSRGEGVFTQIDSVVLAK